MSIVCRFSTREVRTSSLYFKTEDHATLKNKLSRSTMQMGTGCFCITHHSLGEQLASASAQKKISKIDFRKVKRQFSHFFLVLHVVSLVSSYFERYVSQLMSNIWSPCKLFDYEKQITLTSLLTLRKVNEQHFVSTLLLYFYRLVYKNTRETSSNPSMCEEMLSTVVAVVSIKHLGFSLHRGMVIIGGGYKDNMKIWGRNVLFRCGSEVNIFYTHSTVNPCFYFIVCDRRNVSCEVCIKYSKWGWKKKL